MRACFAPVSLRHLRALRVAAVAPLLYSAACGGEVIGGGYDPGGQGAGTGAGGYGAGTSSTTGSGRSSASTGTWQPTTTAVTTSTSTSGGGSPSVTAPGTGTGAGGSPTSVASSTSSGYPTGSSSGGTACAGPNGGLPPSACTPGPAQGCNLGPSACLATADAHAAPSFALRVAQLTMSAPAVFTGSGVVSSVFQDAVGQNIPACHLGGQGGLNWLLAFDTVNGTLTTGGTVPMSDPTTQPYFFMHSAIPGYSTFDASPVTLSAPVDASCGFSSSAGDVNLPIYQPGSDPIALLPLRSLRFHDAAVSPDHNCIGAFDPAALDPGNACAPYIGQRPFTDGGSFDAYISLEEADAITVSLLDESLCVLLSGDPSQWGQGSPTRCKRGAGNAVLFQGDWCSATDQPATAACADAVRFSGTFAASGVTIQ